MIQDHSAAPWTYSRVEDGYSVCSGDVELCRVIEDKLERDGEIGRDGIAGFVDNRCRRCYR